MHLKHLRLVFTVICELVFVWLIVTAIINKSKIAQRQLQYLGFVIKNGKVSVFLSKLLQGYICLPPKSSLSGKVYGRISWLLESLGHIFCYHNSLAFLLTLDGA